MCLYHPQKCCVCDLLRMEILWYNLHYQNDIIIMNTQVMNHYQCLDKTIWIVYVLVVHTYYVWTIMISTQIKCHDIECKYTATIHVIKCLMVVHDHHGSRICRFWIIIIIVFRHDFVVCTCACTSHKKQCVWLVMNGNTLPKFMLSNALW